MRLLRALITTIVALYVLVLLGIIAGSQATPAPHWGLSLAREFLVWLWLPVPCLVVLTLTGRARLGLALLLVPGALFVPLFGHLFVPRLAAPAVAAETLLTVWAHNVEAGAADVTAEVAAIRASGADIVAFQELRPIFAEQVAAALAAEYPHRALHPQNDYDGYGILARYPILEARCVRPRPASRCWQHAVLAVGAQQVSLVNVHALVPRLRLDATGGPLAPLRYDDSDRDHDILTAADWLRTIPPPLVVSGDFNAAPHSRPHRALTAFLTDVYGAAGFGLGHTWPASKQVLAVEVPQLVRIDYVFVSRDIIPLHAEVAPPTGADHRAVVVTLALPSPAP